MLTTCNCLAFLLIRFILVSSLQCQIGNYFKNENIYTDFYAIQSNQTDLNKITDIGFNLIEKVCSAPYQVDGQIIQTISIPNFFTNIFAMCHLVLNQSYFIICTNLPFPFCRENSKNLLKIELEIGSKEICQNLIYFDSEKKIFIFCTNNRGFSIKEIDLKNKKFFVFENIYLEEEDLSCCKMEALQINGKKFLLGFTNCSNWKFYKIDNDDKLLILDSKIMIQQLEFKSGDNFYPIKFQYCQYTIYFTQIGGLKNGSVENCIYQFSLDSDFNIEYSKKIRIKSDTVFKIIVFKQICEFSFSILGYKNSQETDFDERGQQVILGKDYLETQIYFQNDLILIQNLSTLIVVKNKIQNQTYQISEGNINFLSLFNSFYQLDNNQIVFYQFQNNQNFLHLTEKYLYQFTQKGIFQFNVDQNIFCFKIQNSGFSQNQEAFNNSAQIPYTCNRNGSIQVLNSQLNLKQDAVYPIKGDNFYANITNSVNLSEKCLQNFSHIVGNQSYKILQIVQFSIGYYLLISIQNYLHIYQCGKEHILDSLNIENGQVYYYSNGVAIIKNNELYFYILTEMDFTSYLLQEKITQITKLQQLNSILFITNAIRSYVINLSSVSLPLENYFDIIFKNQTILFCSRERRFIFIQYQNFFFMQIADQLFYQDFHNSTIVLTLLKQNCLIVSVSNLNNTISLYDFNKLKLLNIENLFIFDYQFLRPILYKSSMKSHVAIAALKQQEKFVLVFEIGNSPKLNLINIIKCQHFNFQFILKGLYFIDSQNDINLVYLESKIINYILPQQLNLYSTLIINEKFSQVSDFKQIDLVILNFCFDPLPIQDEIKIQVNSQINLQAQDYFYGPIDDLEIKSLSNQLIVQLETPKSQIATNHIMECPLTELNSICIEQLKINYFNENLYYISHHYIPIEKNQGRVVYSKQSEGPLSEEQLIVFQNKNTLIVIKTFLNKIIVFEFQRNESHGKFTQLNNYVLQEFQHNVNFIRIENLIGFELNEGNPYVVFIFCDGKFIQQNFHFHSSLAFNGLIIKQSEQPSHIDEDNYFISVIQVEQNNSYLFFSVYKSKFENIGIYKNFSLYHIELFNKCEKVSLHGYCQVFQEDNFKTIQIGESFIQNQQIQVQLIFSQYQFSIHFKVIYDLELIKKEILDMKIIRHPQSSHNIYVSQFGNILFMNYLNFSTFVFDLQNKEKKYFDYIYNFQDNEVEFTQFNTTHFVIIYLNHNKVQSWALLSFQHNLKISKMDFKQKLKNQTLTILASNRLSNFTAEITLILDENDEKFYKKLPLLDLSLQIICFLLIVLILIAKRENLKNKEVKNIKVLNDFQQNQQV